MPLPAQGFLALLKLTRVLEERDGAGGMEFWFSFSTRSEPARGSAQGTGRCAPHTVPQNKPFFEASVLGLGPGAL